MSLRTLDAWLRLSQLTFQLRLLLGNPSRKLRFVRCLLDAPILTNRLHI